MVVASQGTDLGSAVALQNSMESAELSRELTSGTAGRGFHHTDGIYLLHTVLVRGCWSRACKDGRCAGAENGGPGDAGCRTGDFLTALSIDCPSSSVCCLPELSGSHGNL